MIINFNLNKLSNILQLFGCSKSLDQFRLSFDFGIKVHKIRKPINVVVERFFSIIRKFK